MTDTEINEEISRLIVLRRALSATASALGYQVRALKNKLSGDAERVIKDHAVIRYLERVKGVRIEDVREEIRALSDAAVPFKKCDGMWHASGIVLMTNDDGEVVTVLDETQAENYIGRNLQNGDRATREAARDD